MNNLEKELLKPPDGFGAVVLLMLPIIPFMLIVFNLFLGCSTIRTSPIEGITGSYQSVPYDTELTYDIKLTVIQQGENLSGTVTNGNLIYSVSGTIKDNRIQLFYSNGSLDMWLDTKGTYYFMAGQCIWEGEARAIRFEKVK